MIAMAIAGVLLAAALPVWDGSQRSYRVATAADQLAAELQAARLLAISRNASFQVNLDSAAGTYQIVDPADAANPPRAIKTLPPSVTFQQTPATPLKFFSRGDSQGGTIRIGAGSSSATVTTRLSGRIQVN